MLQKTFLGVYSPQKELQHALTFPGYKESCKYCRWYFDQFLEKILLRLGSNGIILNLMNCLFPKDSLQWFFSQEGNKPDRSRVEKTEKTHTPKNTKNFRSFLSFPSTL